MRNSKNQTPAQQRREQQKAEKKQNKKNNKSKQQPPQKETITTAQLFEEAKRLDNTIYHCYTEAGGIIESLEKHQKLFEEWLLQVQHLTDKQTVKLRENVDAWLSRILVCKLQVSIFHLRDSSWKEISQHKKVHEYLYAALVSIDNINSVPSLFFLLYAAKKIYKQQDNLPKLNEVSRLILKFSKIFAINSLLEIETKIFYLLELCGIFLTKSNKTVLENLHSKIYTLCLDRSASLPENLESIFNLLTTEYFTFYIKELNIADMKFNNNIALLDIKFNYNLVLAFNILVPRELINYEAITPKVTKQCTEENIKILNKHNDKLYLITKILLAVYLKVDDLKENKLTYEEFCTFTEKTSNYCLKSVEAISEILTSITNRYDKDKNFLFLKITPLEAIYLISSYQYFSITLLTFKEILKGSKVDLVNKITLLSPANEPTYEELKCALTIFLEQLNLLKIDLLKEMVKRNEMENKQKEQDQIDNENFLKELEKKAQKEAEARDEEKKNKLAEEVEFAKAAEKNAKVEKSPPTALQLFEEGNNFYQHKNYNTALAKFIKTELKLNNDALKDPPVIDPWTFANTHTMLAKCSIKLSCESKMFYDRVANIDMAQRSLFLSINCLNGYIPEAYVIFPSIQSLINKNHKLKATSLLYLGGFAMREQHHVIRGNAYEYFNKAQEYFPFISPLLRSEILSSYSDWYHIQWYYTCSKHTNNIGSAVILTNATELLNNSLKKNQHALDEMAQINFDQLKQSQKEKMKLLKENINYVSYMLQDIIYELKTNVDNHVAALEKSRLFMMNLLKDKWFKKDEPNILSEKALDLQELKETQEELPVLTSRINNILTLTNPPSQELWQERITEEALQKLNINSQESLGEKNIN